MSVMNRRNSLPPLNEMTTVQVPRPYSVSGADGLSRHSGGGRKKMRNRGGRDVHGGNLTSCARGSGARPAACRLRMEEEYGNSLNLFDIFRFLLSMPPGRHNTSCKAGFQCFREKYGNFPAVFSAGRHARSEEPTSTASNGRRGTGPNRCPERRAAGMTGRLAAFFHGNFAAPC